MSQLRDLLRREPRRSAPCQPGRPYKRRYRYIPSDDSDSEFEVLQEDDDVELEADLDSDSSVEVLNVCRVPRQQRTRRSDQSLPKKRDVASGEDGRQQSRPRSNQSLPRKRDAANEEMGPNPKNPKASSQSLWQDLICPIAHELPIDPVMAEDGHVYERSCIEEYLKRNGNTRLVSPMTKQPMGRRLVGAIQHQKIIESSIENGSITGPLADQWNERRKEKKAMKDLVGKAEGGDVEAMVKVASNYYGGDYGFPEDDTAAFKWYKRSSEAGSIVGMAEMADMLVVGCGVAQDEPQGLVHLGIAAGKGSDLAAFALGLYFADGDHGLPVDKEKAIGFLQDSLLDCPHACMNEEAKSQARQKLDEILEDSEAFIPLGSH